MRFHVLEPPERFQRLRLELKPETQAPLAVSFPDRRIVNGMEFVQPVIVGVLEIGSTILACLRKIRAAVHIGSFQSGECARRSTARKQHVVIKKIAPFEEKRQLTTVNIEELAALEAQLVGGLQAA